MENTKSVFESGARTKKSFSDIFTKKKQLKFWSIVANISLVGLIVSLIVVALRVRLHQMIDYSVDYHIFLSFYWILPAICFFLLYFISMVAITCILINKAKTTIIITPDGARIQLNGLFSKTRMLEINDWKTYQMTQHSRHRKEAFFVLELATKNGSFMFADNMENREIRNLVKIEGGDKTIQMLSENNKSAYEMAKFLGLL